jgi:hypothetical protein
MPQLRRNPRLTTETLSRFRLVREARGDYFQRDLRAKVYVDGAICNAHRAMAQFAECPAVIA